MNITRFFNLSLSEIEEYIKSKSLPALFRELGIDIAVSPVVKERLDLSGVNNPKFRVVKKINLQGVYDIKAFTFPPYSIWIIFTMCSGNPKTARVLQLILDSENIKISGIIYKKKAVMEELDKTMTLNDIIQDEHY